MPSRDLPSPLVRGLSENVEAWIHTDKVFDPKSIEERMDNPVAMEIYEAERCIECGCCIAACATANMRPTSWAPPA